MLPRVSASALQRSGGKPDTELRAAYQRRADRRSLPSASRRAARRRGRAARRGRRQPTAVRTAARDLCERGEIENPRSLFATSAVWTDSNDLLWPCCIALLLTLTMWVRPRALASISSGRAMIRNCQSYRWDGHNTPSAFA